MMVNKETIENIRKCYNTEAYSFPNTVEEWHKSSMFYWAFMAYILNEKKEAAENE